jgi:hypothetical protein
MAGEHLYETNHFHGPLFPACKLGGKSDSGIVCFARFGDLGSKVYSSAIEVVLASHALRSAPNVRSYVYFSSAFTRPITPSSLEPLGSDYQNVRVQ